MFSYRRDGGLLRLLPAEARLLLASETLQQRLYERCRTVRAYNLRFPGKKIRCGVDEIFAA